MLICIFFHKFYHATLLAFCQNLNFGQNIIFNVFVTYTFHGLVLKKVRPQPIPSLKGILKTMYEQKMVYLPYLYIKYLK